MIVFHEFMNKIIYFQNVTIFSFIIKTKFQKKIFIIIHYEKFLIVKSIDSNTDYTAKMTLKNSLSSTCATNFLRLKNSSRLRENIHNQREQIFTCKLNKIKEKFRVMLLLVLFIFKIVNNNDYYFDKEQPRRCWRRGALRGTDCSLCSPPRSV